MSSPFYACTLFFVAVWIRKSGGLIFGCSIVSIPSAGVGG